MFATNEIVQPATQASDAITEASASELLSLRLAPQTQRWRVSAVLEAIASALVVSG